MPQVENLLTENIDLWTSAVKAKNTQGRGSSKKIELYGIKKLRELILELAVRGLLVPQDSNDEPASVLLKKIAAEKAKLIKEGKIKKQKPLPEITNEEQPFELPVGWGYANLGDLINVLNGRAYKKHEMLSEGTPLLRVGNLFTSNEWYFSDLELEAEKYIDNGDLIYAWSASFGPFIWEGGKVIYHYHIWKMDFYCPLNVDKFYFRNYLQAISASIKASGNGIAMIHMTKERMEKLVLPIPPLEEQHRIVAKVDELMALCDQLEQQTEASLSAHQTLVQTLIGALTSASEREGFASAWQRIAEHFDTLFTTEWSIDQLKQCILQLAVMGKLVPQNPNDEPASVLLKKIAAEKAKLIKEGKIKKQKPLPEITVEEKPFELPNGWELIRIVDIAEVKGGKRLPAGHSFSEVVTPHVYIRVTDMKNGTINAEGLVYIHPKTQALISQYTISQDDLYITIAGTIGDVGVVPADLGGMNLTENAAKIIFWSVNKTWFQKMLSSAFVQSQFNEKKKQLAQPKLALHRILSSVICLPPLAEQHRIVAKINELTALCDQLKSRINSVQIAQLQLADAMAEQALG